MQSSSGGNEYKVMTGHHTSNRRVQGNQTGERVIQTGREMMHNYMSGMAAGSRNKPLERAAISQLRRRCKMSVKMDVWSKSAHVHGG